MVFVRASPRLFMLSAGLFPMFFVGSAFLLILLTIPASYYWAITGPEGERYRTDRRFGWSPLWIVRLPFEIIWYYSFGRSGNPSPQAVALRKRVAGTAVIAGMVSLVLGGTIGPPDPFTQTRYIVLTYPIGFALGYVLTSVDISW